MIKVTKSHFTHYLHIVSRNVFAFCYYLVNVIKLTRFQSDHIKWRYSVVFVLKYVCKNNNALDNPQMIKINKNRKNVYLE
jgi:hypothetical protein